MGYRETQLLRNSLSLLKPFGILQRGGGAFKCVDSSNKCLLLCSNQRDLCVLFSGLVCGDFDASKATNPRHGGLGRASWDTTLKKCKSGENLR